LGVALWLSPQSYKYGLAQESTGRNPKSQAEKNMEEIIDITFDDYETGQI
jgi:hypothetical protein